MAKKTEVSDEEKLIDRFFFGLECGHNRYGGVVFNALDYLDLIETLKGQSGAIFGDKIVFDDARFLDSHLYSAKKR